MTLKKEGKLIKQFPELFKKIYSSPEDSCMAFGIECGDGWYQLIYDLSEEITKYYKENKNKFSEEIEYEQIKEKYGLLRVYTNYVDDYIDNLINIAEQKSKNICQNCGSIEDIKKINSSWVTYYCKECRDKYEDEEREFFNEN
jgi:hypothetical protein